MCDIRIHQSTAFAISFVMVWANPIELDGNIPLRHVKPVPAALPVPAIQPDVVITIDDVKDLDLGLKDGRRFHPSLIPAPIARLRDKRVRIYGDMLPTFRQERIKSFLFAGETKGKQYSHFEIPIHCCFVVRLRKGATTSFTQKPIVIEGRMTIRPWIDEEDGRLYRFYVIEDATVRPSKRRAGYHSSSSCPLCAN